MTQAKIREQILDIVHGNIRYADPFDRMNLEKGEKVGVKGFTTQSAEEVLEDIILKSQSHVPCIDSDQNDIFDR